MRDGFFFILPKARVPALDCASLLHSGGGAQGQSLSPLAATFVVPASLFARPRQQGANMPASLNTELSELKALAAEQACKWRYLAELAWPGAARIAVNLTVDFDAMLLRRLNNEPPMELAKGEFGGRVGIWRLLELFKTHAIKATIFTPGRIGELYPEALRAAVADGHELADHMWEHRVPKEPELQRDHLRKTAAALARFSGRPPVGSRSHYAATLLAEEGFIYNSH